METPVHHEDHDQHHEEAVAMEECTLDLDHADHHDDHHEPVEEPVHIEHHDEHEHHHHEDPNDPSCDLPAPEVYHTDVMEEECELDLGEHE